MDGDTILNDRIAERQSGLGHRSESITFSVQTFVVKLATGMASGVVGIGLAIIGFNPDLVQEMSTV